MAKALDALGLSTAGFTPGGLRACGTIHLFILGTEVARLRILGRWKVMETLNHYVQEVAAALALIRIDEAVIRRLFQLKQSSARFRSPPPHPWQDFFDRDCQTTAWTSKLFLPLSRQQKA